MSNFEDYKSDTAVIADLTKPEVVNFADNGIAHNNAINLELADRYNNGRSRKRGTLHTTSMRSFADFVSNEPEESVRIFINRDEMTANAILNFHDPEYPMGHCDYTARLTAKKTCAYERMCQMVENRRVKQKDFALFLEDWVHLLQAKDELGNQIDIKKAITAVRQMKIDSVSESSNSVSNFSESRSRLESIAVKSASGTLPAYFSFVDTLYTCLNDPKDVQLRLSISGDETPQFSLQIVAHDTLKEASAEEFKALLEEWLSHHDFYFGDFNC